MDMSYFEAMVVATTALVGIAGVMLAQFAFAKKADLARFPASVIKWSKWTLGISVIAGVVTAVFALATLKNPNTADLTNNQVWVGFALQAGMFLVSTFPFIFA